MKIWKSKGSKKIKHIKFWGSKSYFWKKWIKAHYQNNWTNFKISRYKCNIWSLKFKEKPEESNARSSGIWQPPRQIHSVQWMAQRSGQKNQRIQNLREYQKKQKLNINNFELSTRAPQAKFFFWEIHLFTLDLVNEITQL